MLMFREGALPAYEELFLYACPKFINANSPVFEDVVEGEDIAHRQLRLFLSDVIAQQSTPTLKSFLKLYTSLGSKKLANFLDVDEEEMIQEMMVMKQCSRSMSRVGVEVRRGGLLDGQMITTSDLNFVIDEVCFRCFVSGVSLFLMLVIL